MRKRIIKGIIIFPIIFSICLAGCGNFGQDLNREQQQESSQEDQDPVSREVFAMDTYMTVTAYGEEASQAVDAAIEEIQRLDQLLSTGEEDSEVSEVNAQKGGTLSEDTRYLVERSLDLWESTGGKFEIGIYPVMQAWGFTDGNYAVPEEETLENLLTLADSSKIHLDGNQISFDLDGMEIDLGGIAKGYTSSRIMDIFQDYGVTSGLVSLGGNVQVLGKKTDGSLWRVAIENPDDDEDYLGILETEDRAVITSGGYERYFEEDGVTYHHIIDPDTGYPANNGLTSVTIVSRDGTLADGLSTSLFIMGKEDAEAYWQKHSQEFDMILLDQEGELYITENIAGQFQKERETTIIEAENQ
jgi:thiamine biosynthesis lipoprotein